MDFLPTFLKKFINEQFSHFVGGCIIALKLLVQSTHSSSGLVQDFEDDDYLPPGSQSFYGKGKKRRRSVQDVVNEESDSSGIKMGRVVLMLLHAIVQDHDNLFIPAKAVHSIGILVLIYKLVMEKTLAGCG